MIQVVAGRVSRTQQVRENPHRGSSNSLSHEHLESTELQKKVRRSNFFSYFYPNNETFSTTVCASADFTAKKQTDKFALSWKVTKKIAMPPNFSHNSAKERKSSLKAYTQLLRPLIRRHNLCFYEAWSE